MRLTLGLMLFVVTWLGGSPQVLAQACSLTARSDSCADEAAAYSAVIAAASAYTSIPENNRVQCPILHFTSGAAYSYQVDLRPPTGICNGTSSPSYVRYYLPAGSCSSRSEQVISGGAPFRNSSIACVNGCEAAVFNIGDGTKSARFNIDGEACSVLPNCSRYPTLYLNVGNGTCEQPEIECTSNQVRNAATDDCEDACPAGKHADQQGLCVPDADECPAGNIKSPDGKCLPGEGQCAAGETRRENGTCGKDADGDGKADEDDDNPDNDPDKDSASGGDSCDAPPSCSGNPIDCMQVKIQWRIDCNTRKKANIAGGACSAMPVCTGDGCNATEHAQLIQQWKSACALEKLANKSGSATGGDGDLEGIKDALTGSNQGDSGGEGNPADAFVDGSGEDVEPDQSGYGWGSSCPANPMIGVFGTTIEFDLSPVCDWLTLGGYIAVALTALGCLRIVAGKSA